jgi:CHAT domain-containing protein
MDLKTSLVPGDLFVSYWLDQRLTVVVGDHRNILSVETVAAPDMLTLITDFEEQVTDVNRYAFFLAEQYRPVTLPVPDQAHLSISEILTLLGSRLVTPSLRQQVSSSKYHRLIIFPDGILNALPIHLLIDTVVGSVWHEVFPSGILYAPSASSYVYACAKRRKDIPRRATILIGDENDPDINREAQNAAQKMPCATSFVFHRSELEHISPETDILYIATHGQSSRKIASQDSHDRSNWTLLFDHGFLEVQDFFRERVRLPQGAVVILSACSVGHLMAKQIHEIDGFIQALFYAGAATVLGARWPILYESAEAVFTGTIERVYQDQYSFGSALNGAIIAAMKRKDVNQLMAGPEANTFFWGPFVIFGCGN